MGDKNYKIGKERNYIGYILLTFGKETVIRMFMFLTQKSRYIEVLMVIGKQVLVFFLTLQILHWVSCGMVKFHSYFWLIIYVLQNLTVHFKCLTLFCVFTMFIILFYDFLSFP
jgi:hypothetical protein